MATIQLNQADLNDLIRRVRAGEEITLTDHGQPVARIVPVEETRDPEKIRRAIEEMRQMSRGLSLGGLKIKDLINEGRP